MTINQWAKVFIWLGICGALAGFVVALFVHTSPGESVGVTFAGTALSLIAPFLAVAALGKILEVMDRARDR